MEKTKIIDKDNRLFMCCDVIKIRFNYKTIWWDVLVPNISEIKNILRENL